LKEVGNAEWGVQRVKSKKVPGRGMAADGDWGRGESDWAQRQLLVIRRRAATARAIRAARTTATGTTRSTWAAEATGAAPAHRRAEQIFRGQGGGAIFEECFQGGGSVGDFVGINHAVVIGVQREENRRQRAACARPALPARGRSAITPLAPGAGAVILLGDDHPG